MSINSDPGRLSHGDPLPRRSSQGDVLPDSRIHPSSEFSSLPPGHAVKFLSTQIPQFSGSEEDDVDILLKKIENVADLHNLATSVRLTAATSRLSGNARRWFDLGSGESTRSWLTFKESITSRFRRRIPHSVLVKKLEARQWNYLSIPGSPSRIMPRTKWL